MAKKEHLRPLGDRIVVKRCEPDPATSGGLLIPETAIEKPTRGVVLAVGPGKPEAGVSDVICFNFPAGNGAAREAALHNASRIIGRTAITCPRDPNTEWPAVEQAGRSAFMPVNVGDVVLFPPYAGNEVEIDGEALIVMGAGDVLCVVETI